MPRIKASQAMLDEWNTIIDAFEGKFEPAAFGICDMDRNVLRCRYYGGELTQNEPKILIPERLEKLLFPKRLKLTYGGRGSAKTRTISAILTEIIRFNDQRVVCLREFLESIATSCYQEIVDEIDRREINSSEMRVTNKEISSMISSGRTTFKGMHNNVTTIKGLANYTIAWLEEIENMSLISWQTLEPTMRAAGSEIWCSFNPRFETDPSWFELIGPYHDKMVDGMYEDDDVLIIEINHMQNPWMTKELTNSMLKMKERDYDRYLWIWEGKFNRKSQVEVMHGKWEVGDFEIDAAWERQPLGADFGFAKDPSTLIDMYIDEVEEILYIYREAWGQHIELDDMIEFYLEAIPDACEQKILGDNSRPETISHLKNRGCWEMKAAEKWPGSIQDGITYLRSFKRIIIHSQCPNTIKEAHLYKHKVDPLTEEIKSDIVDDYNHCWDAIRYGLSKEIRSRNNFFDVKIKVK